MIKYYIKITHPERSAPVYVERGLGIAGVRLTESLDRARRYDTRAEAEKFAAIAEKQKAKETGGELSTVEIVEDKPGTDEDIAVQAAEAQNKMEWNPSASSADYDAADWQTRLKFVWGPGFGNSIEFQMCHVEGRRLYRYLDPNGKPHCTADKWIGTIDAFFCFVRWHVFGMFINFEQKN